MTAPAEREFRIPVRGEIRVLELSYMGKGLLELVDPETGELFTEDAVAVALGPGTRWYRQAQAEDDYAQAEARRALYLNDQIRIERASTAWLSGYHAVRYGSTQLAATPASTTALVTGVAGTPVLGSTTVPNADVYWGRTPNGCRFQVYSDAALVVGTDGTVEVPIIAVDSGAWGNVDASTILTWSNRNANMSTQATVVTAASGGTDAETDAEWASRMAADARAKQGGGNNAQQRAWGRAASNAVDDCFIYPCAFCAGSALVAVSQKRSSTVGPLAMVASATTLASVTAALASPGSEQNPAPPPILVTTFDPQYSDLGIRLTMAKGSASGFTDLYPFPTLAEASAELPAVVSTSTSSFIFESLEDDTLPLQAALTTLTGDDCPALLAWNRATSAFVELSVASIEDLGSNQYEVTLTTALPSWIVAGIVISPGFASPTIVAAALQAYFDERGPGDLFDLETDTRGGRCVRYPDYFAERPYRVGSEVATRVTEALGGMATDSTVPIITETVPDYPTDITGGPRRLVLGHVGIYLL